MRFKEFITENTDITFEDIIRDCQPYLKEINGIEERYLAQHGSKALISDDAKILTVRDDRRPKDTDIRVHNAVNDFFEEKFGWRAREKGIFVTGSINRATAYGESYLVFPIGEFKYLWSREISDLTGIAVDFKYDIKKDVASEPEESYVAYDKRITALSIDALIKFLSTIKWDYNSNLIEGLKSTREIIMYSPKIYLIRKHSTLADSIVDALTTLRIIKK